MSMNGGSSAAAPKEWEEDAAGFRAPARPCLARVSPYLPGKPIGEVRRELGLKRVDKLASNENPLGASPKALRAFRKAAQDAALYPEGSSPLLRRELERRFGLPRGWVIAGNGSDEIVRLLCEALLDPGDEAVVSAYGFIRFRQCAELMGGRVVSVPERGFRHDLPAMAAAVGPRTKLLFIASPNNPTGSYSTRGEVEALLAAVPRRVVVVLDEAYCHYAAGRPDYPESLPGLALRHPNLIVLRTFSKAYGLAGLRVGFGAAHPELIGWLDRVRMPFNVNLPAQAAALAALDDEAFVARSVALVRRERAKTAAALEKLGLQVHPSSANFVLAESQAEGRLIFSKLLRQGVIVRPLDEYGLTRHLRISIGSAAQNARCIRALRAVLRES